MENTNLATNYYNTLNQKKKYHLARLAGSAVSVGVAAGVTAATGAVASPLTVPLGAVSTAVGARHTAKITKINAAKEIVKVTILSATNEEANAAYNIAHSAFVASGLITSGNDWFRRIDKEKASRILKGLIEVIKETHPTRMGETINFLFNNLKDSLEANKNKKGKFRKALEFGRKKTVSLNESYENFADDLRGKLKDTHKQPSATVTTSSHYAPGLSKDKPKSGLGDNIFDYGGAAYDIFDRTGSITAGMVALAAANPGTTLLVAASVLAVAAPATGAAINKQKKRNKAKTSLKEISGKATGEQRLAADNIVNSAFVQSGLIPAGKDWRKCIYSTKISQIHAGVLQVIVDKVDGYQLERAKSEIATNLSNYLLSQVSKAKKGHISFKTHAFKDGEFAEKLGATIGDRYKLSTATIPSAAPAPEPYGASVSTPSSSAGHTAQKPPADRPVYGPYSAAFAAPYHPGIMY